ncbi:MAG: hypothetical protein ACI4XW_08160 [Candidatus Spyradocola sp.]
MNSESLREETRTLRADYSWEEQERDEQEPCSPEQESILDSFSFAELMASKGYDIRQRGDSADGECDEYSPDQHLVDRAAYAMGRLDPPCDKGNLLLGAALLLISGLLLALDLHFWDFTNWMMSLPFCGSALGVWVLCAVVIGMCALTGTSLRSLVAPPVTLGVYVVIGLVLHRWTDSVTVVRLLLYGSWCGFASLSGFYGIMHLVHRVVHARWRKRIPRRIHDCIELINQCLELSACYDAVIATVKRLKADESAMKFYAENFKVVTQNADGETVSEEAIPQQELAGLFDVAAGCYRSRSRRLVNAAHDLEDVMMQYVAPEERED